MPDAVSRRPEAGGAVGVPTAGAAVVVLALAAAGSAAFAAQVLAPRAAPVWQPVLAASLVLLLLFMILKRGGKDTSVVFELGFIYAAAVWIYTCYPLIGFIVNGLEYGPLNDLRLQAGSPTPGEVGRIGWMYVVHLVGFVAFYSAFRGKRTSARPAGTRRVEGLLLLLIVVATQAFMSLLSWRYEWSFVTNLDRYVAFRLLPQLTTQIAGHIDGIRLTAEIALLVFLFQRYARYRLLVYGWLVAIAVKTVLEKQSRTELVLLCFASLILYDSLVRRVKLVLLAALAVGGLLAFIVLGARRTDLVGIEEMPRLRRAFVANEFETLFGNAYDLDERVRARTLDPLPRGFFASDLLAVVPQQLLSWRKTAPADWYMQTMFPQEAEKGIGFCFGTVAESILSGGWANLLLRGALLGLALGVLHRIVVRRQSTSFWWYVFGVWMSVLVYQSFRNTTFNFVALTWYRFLPVVVAVSVGAWLVRAVTGRNRQARMNP